MSATASGQGPAAEENALGRSWEVLKEVVGQQEVATRLEQCRWATRQRELLNMTDEGKAYLALVNAHHGHRGSEEARRLDARRCAWLHGVRGVRDSAPHLLCV